MAKLGFSPTVIGACVNHRTHTKAGVTMAVYVQYDYAREKRQALNAWADRLSAIVTGTESKIISLHGAAAG
jgi:hypothetical protein